MSVELVSSTPINELVLATVEREARQLIALHAAPLIDAVREGHYGTRDLRFAVMLVDLIEDRHEVQQINYGDETNLRRLIKQACEIIADNLAGFGDTVDEILDEANIP